MHVADAGQTVVQVPQCIALVIVSTQRAGVPHGMRPPPQLVHAPPLHPPPVPQLEPQAPQFAASVLRSTHVEPQSVMPTGHVHAPVVHVAGAVQCPPQRPQLLLSV